MKNKGFTLIELLAVIVILAIIALIATPIILNIINDAKVESNERSAELYVDAVEQAIAKENLTREFNPSECEIQEEGILCDGETKIVPVSVVGTRPTGGVLIFRNDKIDASEIHYEDIAVITTNEGTIQEEKTSLKKYNDGEEVYFNVTTGEKCTVNNYSVENSNIGANSGCMKFYAFNDTEDSYTVNLLLDHNTTGMHEWIIQSDYEKAGGKNWSSSTDRNKFGPITMVNQLNEDTKNWKGTITPANYKDKIYTVDYTGNKARAITKEEIDKIVGQTNISNYNYYFDSLKSTASDTCKSGNTTECKYGWLYDKTTSYCTMYGCLNNTESTPWIFGYWTASSNGVVSGHASEILASGTLSSGAYVGHKTNSGIRPVIEVLKSKLS